MTEFPTIEYQGTKSILFTTKSPIGGKNPFLGIAYVVVGGLCIVLGAVFTVTHLIRPRYAYSSQATFRLALLIVAKKTRRPHIFILEQGLQQCCQVWSGWSFGRHVHGTRFGLGR